MPLPSGMDVVILASELSGVASFALLRQPRVTMSPGGSPSVVGIDGGVIVEVMATNIESWIWSVLESRSARNAG